MNEQLLKAIKARLQKQTEFNYGILTADRYVKTLEECVGSHLCYRFAAKGNVSFDDVKRKAAQTLVYANEDMVASEYHRAPTSAAAKSAFADLESSLAKAGKLPANGELQMPKNCLMVFKHTLTTPRKDRDGDILRTEGASPDPKMLLLWQHVHTLPIGKLLVVAEHNSKALKVVSCIVDMNDLCHDAAVMVDNGMARFSHGFRALEFEQMKEHDGDITSPGGFDVKRFEIMEESLVSVPSNKDADVEEVVLSLVEGGKLTSPMMKEYGKTIRRHRPTSAVVFREKSGDYERTIKAPNAAEFEQVFNKANEHGKQKQAPAQGKQPCGCPGGTPKETDANRRKGTATATAKVSEVKYFGGFLEGSYGAIESEIYSQAKLYLIERGIKATETDFIWIAGTYDSYAVVALQNNVTGQAKYFKLGWAKNGRKVKLTGIPTEVEIEVSTKVLERMTQLMQKAFKAAKGENCVHCGASMERGEDGMCNSCGKPYDKKGKAECPDCGEPLDKDGNCKCGYMTTKGKPGVCPECGEKLDKDGACKCGYTAKPEEEKKRVRLVRIRRMSVQRAAALVLAKADATQRKNLLGALAAMEQVEEANTKAAGFTTLLGIKFDPNQPRDESGRFSSGGGSGGGSGEPMDLRDEDVAEAMSRDDHGGYTKPEEASEKILDYAKDEVGAIDEYGPDDVIGMADAVQADYDNGATPLDDHTIEVLVMGENSKVNRMYPRTTEHLDREVFGEQRS